MGRPPSAVLALAFVLGCAHAGAPHAAPPRHASASPSSPAPATTAADADGPVEAESARPASAGEVLEARRWSDDEIADDEATLRPFASKKEMVKLLEQRGLVEDDPPTAVGSMWGDAVGDSFGAGGLGLTGVGEGGGGVGEGIGLGSVGTVGHGAGYGVASGAHASGDSVTNVQVAGVDEGGIVKVHGEHLVVLRRGRLFTLRLSDLSLVSAIDAFAPGVDPTGAWYDEMLVSKDTVVVVGYSYERGGTEIGLFDLGKDGKLAPRSTYHMRSDDYYSSRDYTSRLLGDKLVFYVPSDVYGTRSRPLKFFPAIRKWHKGAKEWEWSSVLEATKIDRPLDEGAGIAGGQLTLHSVVMCDLAKREMTCTARGLLAPPGRVFHVSQDAVYVWTMPLSTSTPEKPVASTLYRLPLSDAGAIGAVRVRGAPTDSFSFDEEDGTLNVLVRTRSVGAVMWHAEIPRAAEDVALLRIATSRFARKVHPVPGSAYVSLPSPAGAGVFANRFVGGTVLYGNGQTWGAPGAPTDQRVFTYDVTGTSSPTAFGLGHGVDRIEAIGDDAIVVGADAKDLHFSAIALGPKPSLAGVYTRKDAAQGETRSHGFFYRSDGERKGVFGLPIRGGGEAGYRQLVESSASVLFVANDGLRFKDVGALEGRTTTNDDGCRASCVDWYGNARPLFVRGRVFALLGYEIVEGAIANGKITETRRASFAPKTARAVTAR